MIPASALPTTQTMPLAQGDAGTEATIRQIWRLIDEGVKDPYVNRQAISIVHPTPPFNRRTEAEAIYRWVQKNIRFTSDIAGKETLRSPREILTVRAGDCDDFVILICSLLGTIGHKLRIVTVASHPADPGVFTHVYPEDSIAGRWVALDAARRRPAMGKSPGYFSRKRAWYMDGNYEDLANANSRAGQLMQSRQNSGARMRLDGLAGLGDDSFSFAQLPADITAATAGAANIIRATNAPSIPYYGGAVPAGYAVGPGGVLTPISSAYSTPVNLSQYMPILLIGGLLLAVMAMRE